MSLVRKILVLSGTFALGFGAGYLYYKNYKLNKDFNHVLGAELYNFRFESKIGNSPVIKDVDTNEMYILDVKSLKKVKDIEDEKLKELLGV